MANQNSTVLVKRKGKWLAVPRAVFEYNKKKAKERRDAKVCKPE